MYMLSKVNAVLELFQVKQNLIDTFGATNIVWYTDLECKIKVNETLSTMAINLVNGLQAWGGASIRRSGKGLIILVSLSEPNKVEVLKNYPHASLYKQQETFFDVFYVKSVYEDDNGGYERILGTGYTSSEAWENALSKIQPLSKFEN
jgi:hypothetical protein